MAGFLGLLPCLPAVATAQPGDAVRRPNIVFAFGDDWGRYAGVYRESDRPTVNDVIETPVFDRLARTGVLFWDAHVSAPSCTPSRGAVLTGRHFYRNGSASQLHHPWMKGFPDPAAEIPSSLELLERAGYHCGITYKTHVPPHWYGGKAGQYNEAGTAFNRYSQRLSGVDDAVARRAALLDEVRGNLRTFLDSAAQGQPFCWFFCPWNTHRPWEAGSARTLWGLDPESLKGRLPAFLPDDPVIRQDFADYLGECMAFDRALGVIVEELEARGLLENTLLVVSGDHGAPGFPRGKCNLYDFGTQVPLAMHWPQGIVNPGRRIDNPTSLIHLAPTFLEAAGVALPADIDGRSLLAILRNGDATGYVEAGPTFAITGRELHVPVAREGNLPYPMRALRDSDFLYIRNFKPERDPVSTLPFSATARCDMDHGPTRDFFADQQTNPELALSWQLGFAKRPLEELYDLRRDQDQMQNLASDPAYSATLARFSSELMRILEETGDPRVVADDAFDRPPYHRPAADTPWPE